MAYTGLGVAVGVGLIVAGPIVGGVASLSWSSYNMLSAALSSYERRRIRARLTVPGHDQPISIRRDQIGHLALVREDQSWGLRVSFEDEELERPNLLRRVWPRERHVSSVVITGDEALRAAAKLMPTVNATGARRRDIAAAVDILTENPDPSHLFARYAAEAPSWSKSGQYVSYLSRPVRLALEMASHEDAERRALEGELHLLESAWRDAEEIASIADGLLLPAATDDRYEALKREARDL